jgi:hypothetical protein
MKYLFRDPKPLSEREKTALIWAVFWFVVLTTGEPSIVNAVANFIANLR